MKLHLSDVIAFVVVSALLLLVGCAVSSINPINPPPVKASPASTLGAYPCQPGTAKQTHNQYAVWIEVLNMPCPQSEVPANLHTGMQTTDSWGKEQVMQTTLQVDTHITMVRIWQGSGGTQFESGVNLVLIYPDGTPVRFISEYDKHVDGAPADDQHWLYPDIDAPAGTIIQLSRDPHDVWHCEIDEGNCWTQEGADIYGKPVVLQ